MAFKISDEQSAIELHSTVNYESRLDLEKGQNTTLPSIELLEETRPAHKNPTLLEGLGDAFRRPLSTSLNNQADASGKHPSTDAKAKVDASKLVSNPPPKALGDPEDHKLALDQHTEFWKEFVAQAYKIDKETVESLSKDLDNLLIFVSLPTYSSGQFTNNPNIVRSFLCNQYLCDY